MTMGKILKQALATAFANIILIWMITANIENTTTKVIVGIVMLIIAITATTIIIKNQIEKMQ